MPLPAKIKDIRPGHVLLLGPNPDRCRVVEITPVGENGLLCLKHIIEGDPLTAGTIEPAEVHRYYGWPDQIVPLANSSVDAHAVRPTIPVMIAHLVFWALAAGGFGYLLFTADRASFFPTVALLVGFAFSLMFALAVVTEIDEEVHNAH